MRHESVDTKAQACIDLWRLRHLTAPPTLHCRTWFGGGAWGGNRSGCPTACGLDGPRTSAHELAALIYLSLSLSLVLLSSLPFPRSTWSRRTTGKQRAHLTRLTEASKHRTHPGANRSTSQETKEGRRSTDLQGPPHPRYKAGQHTNSIAAPKPFSARRTGCAATPATRVLWRTASCHTAVARLTGTAQARTSTTVAPAGAVWRSIGRAGPAVGCRPRRSVPRRPRRSAPSAGRSAGRGLAGRASGEGRRCRSADGPALGRVGLGGPGGPAERSAGGAGEHGGWRTAEAKPQGATG